MKPRHYRTLHLDTNSSKGTACSKKGHICKWTWDTIENYTSTEIKVKEQLVVRNDAYVNEHETLSKLHLDAN